MIYHGQPRKKQNPTAHSASVAAIVTAIVTGFLAGGLAAQEASVRPGVNDGYRDPDVEQWKARLEAEDRAIFKYRHAIVAVLGVEPGMSVADVGAGTGFLTQMIARGVGPEGEGLRGGRGARSSSISSPPTRRRAGLDNVVTVLGDQKSDEVSRGGVADLDLGL